MDRRRLTLGGYFTCLVAAAAGASFGHLTWLEFAGWYFASTVALPGFIVVFSILGLIVGRLISLRWDFAPRLMLIGAGLGGLAVHAVFAVQQGTWDLARAGFADVFVLEAFYLGAAVLGGGLGYIIGKGVNQLCRI